MKHIIPVLLLFTTECWAYEARFDNYKVYRIIPKTDEDLNKIQLLEHSGLPLDFWSDPQHINLPVDVMVPPHKEAQFHEIILNLQLKAEVKTENVQSLIDENSPQTTNTTGQLDWTQYFKLNEIYDWLDDIASAHHPYAKVITVGHSYQGRAIKGVKVSFKKGNKAVFIEGGIHAREWIAPATVTYILNELLTNKTAQIREIAQSYDWYIVPSVNPDGYEYSFSVNRIWRKTRFPHGLCRGSDANRNWDFHWNETGTNGVCFGYYPGTSPFSEPETKSLSEYITSVADNLVVYLSIHSFRQLLLIPYAHGEYPENYSELLEIGEKVVSSLEKRHGTKFKVGNWADKMYASSGVSMDWVKGVHKVPIVYTYELRDKGRYGFLLPPSQIIPVGEEVMDSLVTLIQEVKARGY